MQGLLAYFIQIRLLSLLLFSAQIKTQSLKLLVDADAQATTMMMRPLHYSSVE